jgi:hypothetical protein
MKLSSSRGALPERELIGPAWVPEGTGAFRQPTRRRALGSSARRSRADRNMRSPVSRSCARSAFRCRDEERPIWGSARSTTLPSSSSTSRNTPCAAGCCGPKLMVKFLHLRGNNSTASPRLRGPDLFSSGVAIQFRRRCACVKFSCNPRQNSAHGRRVPPSRMRPLAYGGVLQRFLAAPSSRFSAQPRVTKSS